MTDAIIENIESMIVEGVLKPGSVLPPERQLAKDFGVSRASLRHAISALEARGLISARQGGGNFVCNPGQQRFTDPLLGLLLRHPDMKFQIIELRETLEVAAATYAAERATDKDKQIIRDRLQQLEEAIQQGNVDEEAKADLNLHLSIADASYNAPLSLMIHNLYSMLLKEIKDNLAQVNQGDELRHMLQQQHRELVDKVIQGNIEGARDVARAHFRTIETSFREKRVMEKRKKIATLRSDQMDVSTELLM